MAPICAAEHDKQAQSDDRLRASSYRLIYGDPAAALAMYFRAVM